MPSRPIGSHGSYPRLTFRVPAAVREAARNGLALHREYGRGGTDVGIDRAKQLVSGRPALTLRDTIHMRSYFARHSVDNLSQKDPPSNGWIAWQLWGGHAGKRFVNEIVRRYTPRLNPPRRASVPSEIRAILSKIVSSVQGVYDAWNQNDEGYDEELGSGGICHLIADEIASIASNAGIRSATVSSSHEVHVYTIMRLPSGVWLVDIRPHVYEVGGAYTWRKIKNVVFEPDDVTVEMLDRNPRRFREYADEMLEEDDADDMLENNE